mmetsp:Transcript_60963/g.142715  ORF Transcript_60963/g.142715 Transcript_60963/m.142715 type:complete len:88 (+) Transcript_60963:54-317(+)
MLPSCGWSPCRAHVETEECITCGHLIGSQTLSTPWWRKAWMKNTASAPDLLVFRNGFDDGSKLRRWYVCPFWWSALPQLLEIHTIAH